MKPILLDLFCGAGGAAEGYHRAGFDVVGVDITPQPDYPYRFVKADAVALARSIVPSRAKCDCCGDWACSFHGGHISEKCNCWPCDDCGELQEQLDDDDLCLSCSLQLPRFDAIHASPPCQGYSPHVSSTSSRWVPTAGRDEPRLIGVIRELISLVGVPYVIENVMGARSELRDPLMLCGTMFGLPIARHRLFESSIDLWPAPGHPDCRGVAKRYAEQRGWEYRDMSVTGKGRHAGTLTRWQEIMGISRSMSQHQMAEAIPPAYTEWIGRSLIEAVR